MKEARNLRVWRQRDPSEPPTRLLKRDGKRILQYRTNYTDRVGPVIVDCGVEWMDVRLEEEE